MDKILNTDYSTCLDCIYYTEGCSYYGPENECKLTGNMYFSPDGCKDKVPSDQYITLDKLEEIIEKSNKAIIGV